MTYRKFLIALATILQNFVSASCLAESVISVGVKEGIVISNLEEIEALGLDSWRLHAIKTCEDSEGDVSGIQFILAYVDFDETEVTRLTPIGDMTGNCQELSIVGEIDQIRASYSRRSESVNSIKIIKDEKSKTYGTLLTPYKEWVFGDDQLLMGLHGRVVGDRITLLGTISLFTASTPLCTSVEFEGLQEIKTDNTVKS